MGVSLASFDLGCILKQISQAEFSMNTPESRLRLQKIVYIIQAFGNYLGYNFLLDLKGPYCPNLTQIGCELSQFYIHLPDSKIEFGTPKFQKKFDHALKFFNDLENIDIENIDFTMKVTLAAYIVFLDKNTDMNNSEIVETILKKYETFERKHYDMIYKEMIKFRLINEVKS